MFSTTSIRRDRGLGAAGFSRMDLATSINMLENIEQNEIFDQRVNEDERKITKVNFTRYYNTGHKNNSETADTSSTAVAFQAGFGNKRKL